MRSVIYILSVATIITSAYCAPGPEPNPVPGLELLRRAVKGARSPLPQKVPFTIDKEWCVWSPKGGCWLNEAGTEAYKYMKVDPPKYDWDDYEDDEGVYASSEGAFDAYQEVLYDLYEVINSHAPYDDYSYDYETYIADYEDKYCVWKWEGDCWFNDMVKYVDDLWKDPYKKRRAVRRQEEDWSVYATSTGIQADYALWAWDLLVAVDKNGPLDIPRPDD